MWTHRRQLSRYLVAMPRWRRRKVFTRSCRLFTVLNVQFTAGTFSGGPVETFMADARFCDAGRVPGAAISHRESVRIRTRLQNRFQMSGCHRRQDSADGGA